MEELLTGCTSSPAGERRGHGDPWSEAVVCIADPLQSHVSPGTRPNPGLHCGLAQHSGQWAVLCDSSSKASFLARCRPWLHLHTHLQRWTWAGNYGCNASFMRSLTQSCIQPTNIEFLLCGRCCTRCQDKVVNKTENLPWRSLEFSERETLN